jgi:hypothetical protein
MILTHLGYEVTADDVERAVAKYPPTGGTLKHLTHFTDKDLALIEALLGDLLKTYNYEITKVLFPP